MGRVAALLGGVALGLWTHQAQAQEARPAAEAPAGAYLAARAAVAASDFAAAADLLAEALAVDPDDLWLRDNALVANLAMGRLEDARVLAEGLAGPVAALVLNVAAAVEGDWPALLAALDEGRGAGPLMDGLSRGWAHEGAGDHEAALAAFDQIIASEGLKPFGLFHKALALALAGDLQAADDLLSLPPDQGMSPTRRAVLAHAEILSGLGRNPEALALLDATFGDNLDEALQALHDRLAAGEALPFTFVTSAAGGLSEAYLNVAAALSETEPATALLYARAALALDPARSDAALLAATLLQQLGQPALARAAYDLVPPQDPSFLSAELGRAAVLRAEGQDEAALEVLSRLTQDFPKRADIQSSRGDLLRAMERAAEAEESYDRALELSAEDAGALWYLHFARALTREAQGDWPGTESDLRRALEARPDQPQVLNHLGYSLVERGEKLDEALGLLEQAVSLRPDSGAIVDSLGWAYYKLGRYEEAVVELEEAVTLLPTDAVINDHLGDAYWSVGREREARFQWSRALSLDPEPEDAEEIRRKLAEGLSALVPATPEAEAALGGGLSGG